MTMDWNRPGEYFLRGKMADLLPRVRYVPAQEANANAHPPKTVEWEKSDLVDVSLEDQDSRCSLCLEDFRPPRRRSSRNPEVSESASAEVLTQFPCGHVFHCSCADKWMRENSTCSLCSIQEGSDWSALFSLFREQDGHLRRVVDVDLLHAAQLPWSVGIWAYLCFSADDKYLAVGCYSHSIRVLDTETVSEIRLLEDVGFSAFCFSTDGQLLVTGDIHGIINIWDAQAADQPSKRSLLGHQDKVTELDISEDGRLLVSVSKDQTLRVWETHTGNVVQIVQPGSRPIAVRFTPDGASIKTGLNDGSVKFWHVGTGALLERLGGIGAFVDILLVLGGNSVLVGQDGTLSFWDVGPTTSPTSPMSPTSLMHPREAGIGESAQGNPSPASSQTEDDDEELQQMSSYTNHTGVVWSTAMWKVGPWVASGDENGELHVWNVHTAELQCLIRDRNEHKVRALGFSPKGTLLGACDADGCVRIWKFAVAEQQPAVPQPPANTSAATPPAPRTPMARPTEGTRPFLPVQDSPSQAKHVGFIGRLRHLFLCHSPSAYMDEK